MDFGQIIRLVVGLLLVLLLVGMVITNIGGPMIDAGNDFGDFFNTYKNDTDSHYQYSKPLNFIRLQMSGLSPNGELGTVASFILGAFVTTFIAWLLWPLIQKVFGS